jgi:ADP-ribosylation factor related protein 1
MHKLYVYSSSHLQCSAPAGKITLPSTILQFWDLGGQRGIRNIWHRYFDDCHAVVYVIDAEDRERLGEGWEVFGMFS